MCCVSYQNAEAAGKKNGNAIKCDMFEELMVFILYTLYSRSCQSQVRVKMSLVVITLVVQ